VNEYIDRLLHGKAEVRAMSARTEAAVRFGSMTAADGAESVLRAIGLSADSEVKMGQAQQV